MEQIFFLHDISLISKKKKISNINLKVDKGDFLIIKGSNSTGKSLLLKLFYLKILPSSGSFFLKGEKLSHNLRKKILEFRKTMGVILQNDYLIPFFSVYQNIELASQIQNSKKEFKSRMQQMSKWLDLEEIKEEKVINLSNSQKQKVVIARALINNPKVIVADQPETYLDIESKKKIFFLLESLNKIGSTIIMTSNQSHNVSVKHKILELR